jgi:co-chaperonin GroES (HSP10)
MAYIKSTTEKEKILRNDRNKLHEELKARQKELGLRGMVPTGNQDSYRQLEDIKNEKSHIQEQMTQAKEERLRKAEEDKKAKHKSFSEQLKMYLARRERMDKEDYEKRRITYLDGGFEEYEETIKMTPFRVLTKEIKEVEKDGIILTDNHFDKMSKYEVVCFGDGVYDLNAGDIVILEPYSGIEIISNKNKYRITFIEDVLIKMED